MTGHFSGLLLPPMQGPVSFYYAANMANGDNNTNNGDSIFLQCTVVINASSTSGIEPVNNDIEFLSMYPNPASDVIYLSFYNQNNSTGARVSLFSLEGKRSSVRNI